MFRKKINYPLKYFFILLINLILSKSLFADENKFMCTVENFLDARVVFELQKEDKEFETAQLNRKFLLTITEKNIFLTDTDIENKNSQESYTIIFRVTNTKHIMAVTVNPIGVQSLVFDPIEKNGTNTFQSSFFTYVSHFKCS